MTGAPTVLVVHAVDTEGPLGGDARCLPDGRPEFMDNWGDIVASLAELTSETFRREHCDSAGDPYRFNWFILDFTGFRSNPKNRVARYHDTLDHLRALPTALDGMYWHYHAPPASGAGDEWAESWLESNEHNRVLAHRLLDRRDFPAAFRAGGTIEDEAASAWLDEVILLDFSNRVSERSTLPGTLGAFNWHGAPAMWGSYHPSHASLFRAGARRRFVYRSIDLRSRYNDVDEAVVEECFREAERSGRDQVLSFFSHDNRDMRAETYEVAETLARVAQRCGLPWATCTAVEAHRRLHALASAPVALDLALDGRAVEVRASGRVFQRTPFVAARLTDGRVVRLLATETSPAVWRVDSDAAPLEEIGVAVTSAAGDVTVEIRRVQRNPLRLEVVR